MHAHQKTIDELPKMEHVAHLPALDQTNPSTWNEYPTSILASTWTSMQVYSLEFTAIQEDCAVSSAFTSIAL